MQVSRVWLQDQVIVYLLISLPLPCIQFIKIIVVEQLSTIYKLFFIPLLKYPNRTRKRWALVYYSGPAFFDFEIIPIPNLPNLTDPRIPSRNRGLRPLTPAPIPLKSGL